MQKITNGYFYDVYDIGNNRVLKKQRAFNDIAKSIKGRTHIDVVSNWVKTWNYIKNSKKATEIVKQKFVSIPQELIGNPVFLNKVDYEQDKVILLMEYFATHSLVENKIIVDKYTELVKKFLKYGIHDYVYKFKNSYGVNPKGNVVFIDFNEVIFSKEKTLELAKNKHWQSEAQYRKFEEGELKTYIGMKLDEALSTDIVATLWSNR